MDKPQVTDRMVLVVDDDAQVQFLIKDCLESEGYRVNVASSGPEALEFLKRDLPDLMLLDLRMPKMDGLEVLKAMKSLQLPHLPPVIMVTSIGDASTVGAAAKSGVSGFIVKPFDIELLKFRVGEQLFSIEFRYLQEMLKRVKPGSNLPTSEQFQALMASDWLLYRVTISETTVAVLLRKEIDLANPGSLSREDAKKKVIVYIEDDDGCHCVWPIREMTKASQRSREKLNNLEKALKVK